MRELITDRPDQTESPYTVDAGHFQIEMDFLTWTLDHERSGRTDSELSEWNIVPVNLKVGLLNNVDLQLVFESYLHSHTEDHIARSGGTLSGAGDLATRLKMNFWGNDGGTTSFGMMPFVKWPLPESSLRNGKTEGGVIFPLAVALPWGWDVGAMTEVDLNHDQGPAGYNSEFINSVTFGHSIVGKLSGYGEFFSNVSTAAGSSWIGTIDFGLTYALTEDVHLDYGCNIGLTDAADDLKAFTGISLRF